MPAELEEAIAQAWERRNSLVLKTLGTGAGVGELPGAGVGVGAGAGVGVGAGVGGWRVNQWLKQAVLLSFRLNDNIVVDGG